MHARIALFLFATSSCTLSSGSLLGAPAAADPKPEKKYDCQFGDWDAGKCGGPTEGTITYAQVPDENPPPKGKIGRTVVGQIGFGRCQNPGKLDAQRAPLPAKPADPWIAVDDKKVPAALPLDAWQQKNASVIVRPELTECTAAHDHCLRDCTWFVRDVSDATAATFAGLPVHRRADGIFTTVSGMLTAGNRVAGEIKPGYVAYRTVPATKRLLAVGRLVAVMEPRPPTEKEALSAWTMGAIEWFDDEDGTVKLVDEPAVYRLAATRVVVLTSKDGAAVQLAPGLTATDIVVKADEVYR